MATHNRLKEIKQYFQSLEQYNGKWVVCVKYPDNWVTFPSDDKTIEVVQDEQNKNIWWYCGANSKKDEDVEIDDIIDLVEKTIETNREVFKKLELLKLKRDELMNLFSDPNNSFKKLQTLQFVMSDEDDNNLNIPKALRQKASKPRKMAKKVTIPEEVQNAPEEAPKEQIEDTPAPITSEPTEVVNATDMSKEEIDDLRG